jgi:hypothetical protein
MTRGRAARFIGFAMAATLMTGCAQPAPNRDGWWDEGAHAVDGYWVTWEHPCEPQTDQGCTAAIETAASILHAAEPGAEITRAVSAGYPTMRGDGPNEVSFTFGGLVQPELVILDLADGSRRTIGMQCGPGMAADGSSLTGVTACQPAEFEVWRVTGS